MRILIIGFVVFVIWAIFSTWLYVAKILPAMEEPVAVQPIPEPQTSPADSLAQLYASMPKSLMIYFGFDKVEFTPDSPADISIGEYKNWLDKFPSSTVTITGHTDFIGTADYNQNLGQRRAVRVQKYLEEKGIPSASIISTSKGENEPLSDNNTAEGRAKNRRAEIVLKK